MNMNANYSAGMLEGIAHYHPQVTAWFDLPAGSPDQPDS